MSIQSLRIGVSGLNANQTRLNTISNNISNSSTVAFKKGRAAFSEVLGQEVLSADRSAAGNNVNPSKVGRGVSIASIDRNFSQGSLDQTGVKTDLALSGDGFFVASPGEGAGSEENRLTRAGNFNFNKDGELVTSGGLNVQGWDVGEDGRAQTGKLKNVQFDPNAQSPAKFTSEATLGGNLSADADVGDRTSISNVVYDEQGEAQNVVVKFEKTAQDEWSYWVEPENPANFQAGYPTAPPPPANTNSLEFNPDGTVDPANSDEILRSLNWDPNQVTNGPQLTINLEGITQNSGSTTAKYQSQNGHAAGELADFGITSKGQLQLNFTNGEQRKAAQLAIGDVNNPNGLEQQGDNFYTTTGASGDLQLGRAGRDLQTSVVSGSLESSNVDLADEFASLIEAQRSYQASSRVVTTADQVLQETVQLKR